MKKNVFLGIDKSGKFCCILSTFLDFETIRNNLADLEESDFVYDCTNWNGCDEISRTLTLKDLKQTGRIVHLPHCLEYTGEDKDMGHAYGWHFEVRAIAETTEQHKYSPTPTFTGPRDY